MTHCEWKTNGIEILVNIIPSGIKVREITKELLKHRLNLVDDRKELPKQ